MPRTSSMPIDLQSSAATLRNMADEQATEEGALSFERAEFETQVPPALACGFCGQPIASQYWEINKRTACSQCHGRVQRELEGSMSRAHFWGALQYGALAAAAGSVAWIVISKITGYEIGIVAIGIGYLVGKSVRKGAGGFGGTRYQVLAMSLTYAAIALASLPAIFEAIRHSPHPAGAVAAAPGFGTVLWAWAMLLGIALASPFLGGVARGSICSI